MKRISTLLALAFAAAPAFAGGINLSGPHYQINIIGVENPKGQTLTDSQRRTIFVALGNNGTTHSNIFLTQGPFDVCDGNAFDAAYDCAGNKVASTGAVFQLPCDTNTPTDIACTGLSQNYQVWGRALGTPGGSVQITTCATDKFTQTLVCNTGADIASFTRSNGKPTFQNVTSQLTTINACFENATGTNQVCGPVPLFESDLQNFFWDYANSGLRLLQLRFYPVP